MFLLTGLFFQWVACSAIWMTGFVLNGIQSFPQFYPLAMLGGFLWCTGEHVIVWVYNMMCLIVNWSAKWDCFPSIKLNMLVMHWANRLVSYVVAFLQCCCITWLYCHWVCLSVCLSVTR